MKLATIRLKPDPETDRAVADSGFGWSLLPTNISSVSDLLRTPGWAEIVAQQRTAVAEDEIASFENPLPEPAKVICCGLNYRHHILEMGRDLPEFPTLFAKYADTLIGPSDEIRTHVHARLDWEAELAVVIGSDLHRASRQQAQQGIAGYTISNDISMRDWQRRTLQWFQGKAHDATTPVGPVVVTADALDPEQGLRITCAVNRETVQDSSTDQLVFDCADLVAYISGFTRLRPGDLVLTGTPGGVGMGMEPPRFLNDGDIVTTSVEGIGTLTNTVVFA
ncbi:fumarylacetoacetate hydrolase family protein [Nesterenkonia ebinurensis]|uniref:fumarylacetoacetate hydrolase family protein n=1 Tax=Nesterenkonia ebinurensis TaxID=2608252 RepID=UPI00123D751B|nr:fumarylacetoacetate hydrolase family protein [Nesterenkonia ebinurensis]